MTVLPQAHVAGWEAAWRALGVAPPPPNLREQLWAAYAQPQRHYHTQQHLAECLDLLETWRPLAADPSTLTLALWFHDAVYEPRAGDNEVRSAAWARDAMAGAGCATAARERVHALVLATAHAAPNAAPARDPDTALLLDIDLAILGAPPARFDEYERQVRQEYAHVPDLRWAAGRAALLRGFLERPVLYLTEPLHQRFEQPARLNLARSVAALGGAPEARG